MASGEVSSGEDVADDASPGDVLGLITGPNGEVAIDEALPCGTVLDYTASKDGFLTISGTISVPKTHMPEIAFDIKMKSVCSFLILGITLKLMKLFFRQPTLI